MSDYALEWFDYVITELIVPSQASNVVLSTEQIEDISVRAERKRERIRLMLMRQLFGLREEGMMEAFVQQYQSCLIMLLDRLESGKKQTITADPARDRLISLLSEILRDLLNFIETYFSKYFDTTKPVPKFYLSLQQKAWRQQAKEILAKCNGVEHLLFGCLERACQHFLGAGSLSYKQLQYGKFFFEKVGKAVATMEKQGDPFSTIEYSLIYLNFNDALFLTHLIKIMEQECHKAEDAQTGVLVLQRCHQQIQQISCKPGFIFNEELPNLQDSISQWVNFQTEKFNQPMNEHVYTPAPAEENQKIQLSVSVAMLGLFIRLLTEEKIITTRNQAALIRFFAASFATSKQSSISAESLYGSYFKPQPGTIKMMTECLLRLQQCIRKKF